MIEKSSRNPAMDIIRCFALFCGVSVHFFLNSGFYDLTVQGPRMFVMVVVRSAFMVSAPLFIMLSGYLMCNKMPSRNYYCKIVKTLSIYVLASLCCQAFKGIYQGEAISVLGTVTDILAFTAAPYSWYVEMYLGLFLLIPYLNILYKNIPSKKQKQILLFILLFLTSLPDITNIYNLFDVHWWRMPSSSSSYANILPDWWINLYPITYYYLGSYFREYPLRIRKTANILAILLVCFVNGTFNYYRSYNATFIWGKWQDWGSLLNVLQTVLVFNLFAQLNDSHVGNRARSILSKASDWCFGAYLVSWIFDQYFYNQLRLLQPVIKLRFNYFILIVPLVFVFSLCLSAVLNLFYTFASTCITALSAKTKKAVHIPH